MTPVCGLSPPLAPPSPSLLAKLFGALGMTDSEVCEGAFHNEWDIGI